MNTEILLVAGGIVIVSGTLLVTGFLNRIQRSRPLLDRRAAIIAKRQEISGGGHYTTYFVTCEFEAGERQEYEVKGPTFGLLIEGDKGILTAQGNAYIKFKRT